MLHKTSIKIQLVYQNNLQVHVTIILEYKQYNNIRKIYKLTLGTKVVKYLHKPVTTQPSDIKVYLKSLKIHNKLNHS